MRSPARKPEPAVSTAKIEELNAEPEATIEERSSAWTLPILCAGIAVLASCLIIPAADDNRRIVYEREHLAADLVQLKTQIDVNSQFLKSVGDDPALLERLAQRQMKMVRDGTSVLDLDDSKGRSDLSPYLLLSVPPPAALAEYKSLGGRFATLCRQPRARLFLIGGALLAVAFGLISGESRTAKPDTLAGE